MESGVLTFQVEVGSSVDLDFFDDIASTLENIPGIHFRAGLFDSSSNGTQVWQLPEKDPLDIDDKHVLFVGDMEEDLEEMKELVEDACTLQDALDEDTEVLIIGHNVDQSLLDNANEKGLAIYTEQDFWGYIEELPG